MIIKISSRGILWNYIGIFIALFSNILLLPILLKYLSSSEVGLWYVFSSLGSIVTLFDFGFNPTFARNIAYCWSGVKALKINDVQKSYSGNPNYNLLMKVVYTCKYIYMLISIIALVVLLVPGSMYIYHIAHSILNNDLWIAWVLYVIAIFMNLYYGYYTTLLRGVGAVEQYNKINILARLIQIILSVILLVIGWGLMAAVIGYLVYGVLLRYIAKSTFYSYTDIKNRISDSNEPSIKDIKEVFSIVWHNAWRDGIVAVANFLSSQSIVILASLYLSLAETGIYSIAMQLVTALGTVSGGVYSAYQPAIQSSYAHKDYTQLKKLMGSSLVAYIMLYIVGTVGVIYIGLPFLKIVKHNFIYDVNVIWILMIYGFFYYYYSYNASFISTTNRIPYVMAYIVSGILGVLLSVILIKYLKMGVWGLVLGPFIIQAIYNFWKWPKEACSILGCTNLALLNCGYKRLKSLL